MRESQEGGVYFGLSWMNMSASYARAILISVPNMTKGETGAVFLNMCVRSLAICMSRSAEDVLGIVPRHGKTLPPSFVWCLRC